MAVATEYLMKKYEPWSYTICKNSRITVDLNMKGKTITPGENLGEYINYLGIGKDFLNTIQKALIHGGDIN